jgi:hypothetical protein
MPHSAPNCPISLPLLNTLPHFASIPFAKFCSEVIHTLKTDGEKPADRVIVEHAPATAYRPIEHAPY